MRYLPFLAIVCLAACSSEIYVRDGVTDGDTFYLAPVAWADTDPVLQSWVAYSLAKSVCQLELGGQNPARQSSFDCELRARSVLVDDWDERRTANPTISDAYLDDLLSVRDAGYLGEYTAHYFGRDTWQLPATIDPSSFTEWRRTHLRRHRPQTRIIGSWGYGAAAGYTSTN